MSPSTTVLFVPGAWHSPGAFMYVGKLLQDAGYNTKYVVLPSVGPTKFNANTGRDIMKIRHEIQKLVDGGQRVVVFCHSYGGVPTSDAVKGLDIATRQKQNLPGGVSHLFYCCAFMLPEGKSLKTAFGKYGEETPFWQDVSADQLSVTCAMPEEIFYHDMPEDEVEMAVGALKAHSNQTFSSPVTYAAWKHIPTTYFYCLKDRAIPIEVQKIMVEEFGKDVKIRTETIDASHSPFFSRPAETAAAIRRAAGEKI